MPVDYEVEYDNRARVPEHPEIFARWQREARRVPRGRVTTPSLGSHMARRCARSSIFSRPRTTTRRRSRCSSTAATGARSSPRCFRKWRRVRTRAASPSRSPATICVRSVLDRRHHRADARGLPDALAQTPAAHFRLRPFGRRTSRRLHGGDRLEGVRFRRAGRSCACRLRDLRRVRSRCRWCMCRINQDLRLDEAEARRVSPLHWNVPAGTKPRCRRRRTGIRASFCARARRSLKPGGAGMTLTRYEEIAGTNHFTVVDPLNDPNSAMTARVARAGAAASNRSSRFNRRTSSAAQRR